MKTSKTLLPVVAILTVSTLSCNQYKDEVVQPNIVLIMSDDMGFSDLGYYGGEINTPNLDMLAQNGLRFTQFYNAARCCPTRASLLTGLHPHQVGIGHMTYSPNDPDVYFGFPEEYSGELNYNGVTIAEVLKSAGYTTLMTGKWHLGLEKGATPLDRGFDRFYGLLPGASNFFRPVHPLGITYMDEPIEITDEDYYTTNAFTEYAIKFMKEARGEHPDNPFFLYLSYTAPHWPIQAPKEDIDKYRGRYMKGWSQLRSERHERMINMGLIDKSWPLTPLDAREWDSLSEEKKVEMDLRMAIYAAMIDRMDQNIGKVISYLEAEEILENTLIIFLNDNGASAEYHELGTGPASQLETKEGLLLTYGRAWANLSNTPFREYKRWVHEGGITTPFIVHWPEGITAEINGNIVEHYSYLPDIMATFIELTNADYPDYYNENAITPHQGNSFAHIFRGVDKPVHDGPIFFEHEGNKAVRYGNYKLVSEWSPESEYNWELFDMKYDRTEMNNLGDSLYQKSAKLIRLWEEWANEVGVFPWSRCLELFRANRNR